MRTDIERMAGPKEWIGLAVLALPTLLLSLDVTVLHLAVPHLSADLKPSSTQTLWIIDIYGFMIAGFLVTMGTLGDRIGRRRLLLAGAAAFGAASVLAAYSTSAEMLIAARTLLGVAGATIMPSTLSLISNMFRDPRQRGLAIGVWATMFSVGIALGPVVGGLLLENFWWGSVFLLGVPVMVILLAAAPFLLPEFRDPGAGRLDLPSVLLSLATLLPITFAIKELPVYGPRPLPLIALAAGLAAGAAFVRRQRRLAEPLLDLKLFGNRAFRGALLIMLISMSTLGAVYLFVTQYLQLVAGLPPMRAGLWLLAPAIGLIVTSMAAPLLARRIPAGHVLAGSLVLSAVGFALMTQVTAATPLLLLAAFFLLYAGSGPVTALSTDLVVGAAPPEKAGAASALGETSGELGLALGIAILGSVGTAAYRGAMTGSSALDDVPAAAADGVRESLATAVATADGLGAPLAGQVLGAAKEAFIGGLTTVAAAGAVLMAGAAVLAVITQRRP
ncbi:MFS transporter [Nonomuraea endophytica]|uniref:DHA2 family multidrug resistance protein-like MFS transporter n=1 Tax=Nonomuraea endophytica TaxID=714136 RepID=A0A7W8ELY2_9ACTN|nr:MFS transporter [Nonomuraea endophytica]MBB5083873.1 DHA2 family multidrug resistance protein-like MFS transporter [Nonomuraea endophytica]